MLFEKIKQNQKEEEKESENKENDVNNKKEDIEEDEDYEEEEEEETKEETKEEKEKKKLKKLLKKNLKQFYYIIKTLSLVYIGQYRIKRPKKYNQLQTSILASECLSKEPSLIHCIEALEKGADPNAIIDEGLIHPIHAVAKKANVKLIECLINAGADINAQNGRNQTALIIASDSTRTDSGYISVIRYLSKRKDSKINLRDVGGNTALLNGIYRNNVWITRELLLAGALLTIGEGSPCEISLFILAQSIYIDVTKIPDTILTPWNYSTISYLFSLRGKYDFLPYVYLQLITNSDISFIYRMIRHRKDELEESGVILKEFHPYGTRSPEQLELERQQKLKEEEQLRLEREKQREDKLIKKKVNKRLKREEKEKERWEGVLKGIEAKVNHEYGFHQYLPSHEPMQKWVPMDEDRKMDDISEAASIIEKRARTAASRKSRNGTSNSNSNRNRNILPPSSIIKDNSNNSETSPGKRWKVVEIKRNGVYSTNPFPGAIDFHK